MASSAVCVDRSQYTFIRQQLLWIRRCIFYAHVNVGLIDVLLNRLTEALELVATSIM